MIRTTYSRRWSSCCAFVDELRVGFLMIIAAILLVIPHMSSAQSEINDVHIYPRTAPQPAPPVAGDASMETHTDPIRSNVDVVLVPVTVTDPMNRLVLGLDKENFQVYEGKNLQKIQHFSSEDVPISLGIIFDTSGSMGSGSKIEKAREAVVEFLKTSNPQDESFLITFADNPQPASDFTNSVEEIQNKLVYTAAKGRTALLDAIYLGITKMREAKYPKKALLIISDGGDNHSRYDEREIQNLIKEADVMIYAIGIYDSYFPTEEERMGPMLLSDITELTGGRTFTLDNPNDLVETAEKIGVELRNQYVLGYHPAVPIRDGKWHKIRVKLLVPRGLPSLRLYAKKGYYAPTK
jgi:Ca-activated chloride channel family protein